MAIELNVGVRLGEIFEVEAGELRLHTKLQEFLGDGEFSVLPLTLKGVPLRTHDRRYRFSFFRPEGIFVFEADMAGEYVKNGIALWRFRQASEITKIQRRQYYRMPIGLDVVMVDESDKGNPRQYKCRTITLSENSVHLSCYTLLALETEVCVKIPVSARETIPMHGKIIKNMEPKVQSNPFEMVVLFAEAERYRPRLARYVFTQQIVARNRRQK